MKLSPATKIYVADHRGLVGSAITRHLRARGFKHLILKTHAELDLLDTIAVADLFQTEWENMISRKSSILARAPMSQLKN